MAMTPRELVAAACPMIGETGWAHYFVPATLARGSDLGLDVLGFYILGRGGVLGDVEWQVVSSAFGYFNPDTIRDAWTAGREKVAPRDAGRAFLECCQELGRSKLALVDGLEEFCEAAEAVNAEAVKVPGLALHAGISAEPLPGDPPARAFQLVSVLREFRGGAHLVAVVASGLTPKEAHYMQRPDFMGLFGWPDGDVPEVADEHSRRLADSETLTDEIVLPAYSVLDDKGAEALVSGIEAISAAVKA